MRSVLCCRAVWSNLQWHMLLTSGGSICGAFMQSAARSEEWTLDLYKQAFT
jgi:hypothetical protein